MSLVPNFRGTYDGFFGQGEHAALGGARGVVLGQTVITEAEETALGFATSGSGVDVVRIGANAAANGNDSTTVGDHAISELQGTAVGSAAWAAADGSTAVGFAADAQGTNSVAVGLNATAVDATSTDAIAIGRDTMCTGADTIAIGRAAVADVAGGIALGTGANVSATHLLAVVVPGAGINVGSVAVPANSDAQLSILVNGAQYYIPLVTN